MIPAAGQVAHENRGTVVDRDEGIDGAIVVKIADRKAAGRQIPGKNRATLRADVCEASSAIVKEQHRLAIGDVLHAVFDHEVRMTVAQQKVEVSVVVVI